ncbi:unnamed protein product [Somion occarium]|uniref:Class E vacuolar protein-sorting machinery protein HSE1 n=1 Tax=Somion occarium TaxID=3059160 RepID=A0ABP1E5Z7_9APHY
MRLSTTDENMTSENWELILNLCDKVQDEGEQGARNVVAAILKRLAHRNPNVQLYTLTLAEALTKNCGIHVHREIASRAFTQGLERIVTDRNTHDKVKRRTLSLIAVWTSEFEKDPTLGIMEELYENLKGKGYKFEAPEETPPPEVDDEVRRREEEELQRALEMSMHDKGGRGPFSSYSLAAGNAGSSGAGSSSNQPGPTATSATSTKPAQSQQAVYGGYVPSANPSVSASASPADYASHTSTSAITQTPSAVSYTASSPTPSSRSTADSLPVVTRVRALHTFEPTEAGELGFEKGDIIKVVDRGYKDWWRGQLKGRTGIFPVNYVEPLPEPTAAELAKEAEQEAAVFNQAANVDRLLTALRQMDPAKDNLADNEEIQELYRSCMSLRPKIVKLIDKYSQKRADLVSMNESFVKARTIFDRMMEESLARHTGVYDGRPSYAPVQPYPPRPDSRAPHEYPGQGPQAFGWNPNVYDQPGYNAYPAPPAAYAPGPEPAFPGAPTPYGVPDAYGQHTQPVPPAYGHPQPGQPQQPPYGVPAGYGAPTPHEPQGYPSQVPPQAQHVGSQPPPQVSPPLESTPASQPLVGYQGVPPQPDVQAQYVPQQQPQIHPQLQSQPTLQSQPQPQQQAQPIPTQPATAAAAQPQTQVQAQPQPQPIQQQQQSVQQQQPQGGPPFVFDPNGTYEDPNVQAWAQYYAHGGTDPTGSVYFISVPGVKEEKPAPSRAGTQEMVVGLQPQQQQPQSAGPTAATPLNVQHVDGAQPAAVQTPSSPSQQQSFYQPPAGAPAQSTASPQPTAYGASPYGASSYPTGAPNTGPAAPGGGDQQAWQQQYYNMPNQFANMSVGGEGTQAPGPQVGTPA